MTLWLEWPQWGYSSENLIYAFVENWEKNNIFVILLIGIIWCGHSNEYSKGISFLWRNNKNIDTFWWIKKCLTRAMKRACRFFFLIYASEHMFLYSLELSYRVASTKYPQHMFLWQNEKTKSSVLVKIKASYLELWISWYWISASELADELIVSVQAAMKFGPIF